MFFEMLGNEQHFLVLDKELGYEINTLDPATFLK